MYKTRLVILPLPRSQTRGVEDCATPGYTVFTNGKKMLYTGPYVRDEDGAMLYGVFTLREATDLDEARRKIHKLQKLTTLYQDQLRTLRLQVLGQEIVADSEIMQKILERALKIARLDGNVLLTGRDRGGEELARPLHSHHESPGAGTVHPRQLRESTRIINRGGTVWLQ